MEIPLKELFNLCRILSLKIQYRACSDLEYPQVIKNYEFILDIFKSCDTKIEVSEEDKNKLVKLSITDFTLKELFQCYKKIALKINEQILNNIIYTPDFINYKIFFDIFTESETKIEVPVKYEDWLAIVLVMQLPKFVVREDIQASIQK